jgi:hypothetical protein
MLEEFLNRHAGKGDDIPYRARWHVTGMGPDRRTALSLAPDAMA